MAALSAGTYNYEDCINCDGTVTTAPLPHPVYSTAQNVPVVQLTAVALGGFNGLNN